MKYVMGLALVAILAVIAMCVFLPSDSVKETDTAIRGLPVPYEIADQFDAEISAEDKNGPKLASSLNDSASAENEADHTLTEAEQKELAELEAKEEAEAQALREEEQRAQAEAEQAAAAAKAAEAEAARAVAAARNEMAGKKLNLCFFSFNNPNEITVARNFAHRISKYPGAAKITVTENQLMDADPIDSIMARARKGADCDGVVLSGHHNVDGEFWGDRTSGDLEVEDLEEQSCRSNVTAWFSHAKALWLQGCHTSSSDILNKDVDADDRVTESTIMNALLQDLDLGDLESSLDDLVDRFEENIEEENILTDYLRLFPNATIFTWKEKAPGEKAGSHWSFPFHVVQTAYVIDSAPQYFEHPLQRNIPQTAAIRYNTVLYEMLTRPTYPRKHPGVLGTTEKTHMEGWKQHGRKAFHKRRFSFDNAGTIASSSLMSHDYEVLRTAKSLRCALDYVERTETESSTALVNYLLKNEALIPHSTYTLWAILRASGNSAGLRQKMRDSQALKQHVQSVINSGTANQRRKADYRKFWSSVTG